MQKYPVILIVIKTLSFQINGFLPLSEDKEMMKLDISWRCIVTGWGTVGTNWKTENFDSVLGEKSLRGEWLNPGGVVRFFSLEVFSTRLDMALSRFTYCVAQEFGLVDLWRRVLHSKLIMILWFFCNRFLCLAWTAVGVWEQVTCRALLSQGG